MSTFISTNFIPVRLHVKKQPEAMQRFLRAFVEAIARVKQDKPYAKQLLAKYLVQDQATCSGMTR